MPMIGTAKAMHLSPALTCLCAFCFLLAVAAPLAPRRTGSGTGHCAGSSGALRGALILRSDRSGRQEVSKLHCSSDSRFDLVPPLVG